MPICNTLLDPSCSKTVEPVAYTNSVIQTIFTIFMIVGVAYFLWYFIMAGYHFIQSQGDPKKFEQARDSITHSVIGLVVIFSVYAALRIIGLVFGIDALKDLNLFIPTL